jgi:HSP20 family protein
LKEVEIMVETEKKEGRGSQERPWQAVNPFDAVRVVVDRVLDTVLEPIVRMTPPEVRVAVKRFVPAVDVIEEDDDVRIEVEIPGMSAEDIALTLSEQSLVIRGEKKPEKSGSRGFHRSERSYGSFRRVVQIPVEVDRERVDATFKNGVLIVVIPKSHEAARKVQIRVDEG